YHPEGEIAHIRVHPEALVARRHPGGNPQKNGARSSNVGVVWQSAKRKGCIPLILPPLVGIGFFDRTTAGSPPTCHTRRPPAPRGVRRAGARSIARRPFQSATTAPASVRRNRTAPAATRASARASSLPSSTGPS